MGFPIYINAQQLFFTFAGVPSSHSLYVKELL